MLGTAQGGSRVFQGGQLAGGQCKAQKPADSQLPGAGAGLPLFTKEAPEPHHLPQG